MNFETWEPAYEAILSDFGFDRAADERARDVAAELAPPFPPDQLDVLADATVAIAGAGPSLTDDADLERAATADAVVAASTAVDVLADAGITVDVMVTDLDKNPETARRLTASGTPVAAHAHGDNVPAVRTWLPRFTAEHVLVTTQAAPRGPVVNHGGFTDGDRAAFLADHAGAAELVFVGWDFADPSVSPMKAHKLAWAARLLHWLELRRDARFDVLDDHRAELSLPWLSA
ncbi:6-hydroxymethylpterin diphosphokinase MptE-like protein [Halopenitus sp. POP-27]|uniref:6-hydroxymethylpterin diphosphokinase MptE-like protein n=1 Tax=Halopenitus sp. POP-27 TaxID=2994425 RepID=UPI0024683424|nr:6-hydroxymethylpterin diphosphokinase MptE-like protein [Halopenitus sp. POP-27]